MNQKTKLYIVRHSETLGNVEKRLTGISDYDITENGKYYIEKLTQALQNISFSKMYSSMSDRTKKTITPIAVLQNKEIIQLKELEEMNFGKYDGWKWEDVNKIDPKIKEQQNEINEIKGIPGQESMEDVTNRMYKTIENIMLHSIGENILICSHGVAIEAFLRKITNLHWKYEREKYCQHCTAINELEFDSNGKFKILRMADISHLKKYF